jgi:aquaporin Z
MNKYSDVKAYIAEFIGTFTLVFLGCASVWAAGKLNTGPIVPAFAHGLSIVIAAYTLGHISGAHINPAVTLACAIDGAISWPKAVVYWIVQILAAIVAAFVLTIILPNQAATFGAFSYGANTPTPNTSFIGALLLELILTFLLASSVLQAAVRGRAGNMAGLAIGLTLTAAILAGGAITGASLNPARTLGPAIVAGQLSEVAPYLIGTLLGGALAAVVHRFVLNPDVVETVQEEIDRSGDRPRTKARR